MERSFNGDTTLVVRHEVLASLNELAPLLKARAWMTIEEVFACARQLRPGAARWNALWGSSTVVVAVGDLRLVFAADRRRCRVVVGLADARLTVDQLITELPLWRSQMGVQI